MSHLATISVQIKDIEAMKAACAELGWTFSEGKQNYRWWGSEFPKSKQAKEALAAMSTEQRALAGRCEHSISMNGCQFDIGLVKTDTGYSIVADDLVYLSSWNKQFDKLGEGASKLLQLYGVHKAQIEAKKRGLLFTRKQVGSKIQCTVSGM